MMLDLVVTVIEERVFILHSVVQTCLHENKCTFVAFIDMCNALTRLIGLD